MTHINTLGVHCCCKPQHLGNQENSHDHAGPGGWSAASCTLNSPVLFFLKHSTPEQQAGCTIHTSSRCHVPRLLPPASCAGGGLVRGQGAKSHSLCLPEGAEGGRKGALSLQRLEGPGSSMEQTGRCVMTFQQKHVVGAGLCQGVS